ncbi:cytosol aminopeptidase-like [Agrilus planipennis]|uniref:Cytosol aminopeptidase n=1 Tax=Agrilus planipennis TaxID=224129 RepID=A0A1W4X7R3_AGRPL|nr:cytosol aminopeptidase-like [Agrilus planipennis]
MLMNCSKILIKNSKLALLLRKIVGLKNCRNLCAGADLCSDERKGLVLGVYIGDGGEPCLTPTAKKFNDCVNGKLLEVYKRCCARPLQVGDGCVFNNLGQEFYAVALVGLGSQNLCYNELEVIDEGTEAVRQAAAVGSQSLIKRNCTRVLVEGLGHPEQAAEGSALALWRYQENKQRKDWWTIPSLELYEDPDTQSFQRGLFKAECQNLARRLSDTPANQMTPLHFAQEAVNELCPCGIKVEVHDKDWIEARKMNAFLTVARGSCEPPIFLEMNYCGEPRGVKPIMIVAKGVTYDSGGLCLKPKHKMSKYKGDVSGAAAVVGAMKAAAALSLPLNITGLIPLCENMPSGMAMKSGDIVCALNSKSIEIEDCDNEGRLLLVDAFVWGQNFYKPRLIIDVATLTFGVKKGLGSGATGVFVNSETLWSQVRKASVISGDRVWRLPLWKAFTDKVTNYRSHDVNNKGYGRGSACLGAAFLQEFIQCVDWIHFDTTGTGLVSLNKVVPYLTKGRMTGRPTRTLIQLLYQLACPAIANREVSC